jgi:hypothetical protein
VENIQTDFIHHQFGIRFRLSHRLFTILWNFRAYLRHVLQASPATSFIPRLSPTP